MAEEKTPYIPRNPGDLISAEDWNQVQVNIKEDIEGQVSAAKEDVKKTGVERADNADQFDKNTPKDWTDKLDQRYAPKVHYHEGLAAYRRYFKRIKPMDPVILEHKLGRFPLVDLYELETISIKTAAGEEIKTKFFLYYHHEEFEVLFPEVVHEYPEVMGQWGVPFEQMLREYNVKWERDDSLGDVYNDFLDAFFKPPVVDHMEHKTSEWVDKHRESIVGDLMKRDEWPDIRWLFLPFRLTVKSQGFKVGMEDSNQQFAVTPAIDVIHLNYDKLGVLGGNLGEEKNFGKPTDERQLVPRKYIDLMILLRS